MINRRTLMKALGFGVVVGPELAQAAIEKASKPKTITPQEFNKAARVAFAGEPPQTIGITEDLSDFIYDIRPTETPFIKRLPFDYEYHTDKNGDLIRTPNKPIIKPIFE